MESMFVFKLGQVDVVQEWDVSSPFFFLFFFFQLFPTWLNLGFHYDFYQSVEVKVCIFIRICFDFFLILQKESRRSSSAGWCLQPRMWLMQVIQPVRTKRVLMIWHYEIMKLPCSTLATLLHTPCTYEFGSPFAFWAASILRGTLHIPVIRWQTFCTFVLMGFSNCTTSKRGGETLVKRMGIVSNHTQPLDPKGPKMCQGNVPCTMTPPGGWEGSMRSC